MVFAPLAFVPLHAQTHLGAGTAQSSWLMIAFALGSAVFSLTSAQFVRRLGERGMLVGGAALLLVSWPLMAAAPSMATGFVAAASIGIGTMLFHNTLQVHATQMAPESRGASMALFAAMLFMSQSLSIAIGGYIADRFGTTPIFLFCAVVGPLGSLFFYRSLARRTGIAARG